MKYKILFPSHIVLLLLACTITPNLFAQDQKTIASSLESSNNPSQSRLRLYERYAHMNMYTNTSCEQWESTKVKNYFKSMTSSFRKQRTISIGMPPTENSLAIQNGKVARVTFKELIVEPNKPIVLDARRVEATGGYSCQISGSFIPQAGQDYEAWYSESNNTCQINIHKISKVKEKDLYQTQELNELKKCKQ